MEKTQQDRKTLFPSRGTFKTGKTIKSEKDKILEKDKKKGRKNFAQYVEENKQGVNEDE